METIFLLVETEVGRLDETLRRIKAVPNVTEVQAVTGPFDLIVKVEASQINQALDVVVHKIRKIPGIKSTETLVTVATV
jgi:DNA-binding Lrp family transcriptional regulator